MITAGRVLVASLFFLVVATSAAAEGALPGRWSHRFEAPTSRTGPLAVVDGEMVAGEHRLEDGEWKLLGAGIQPAPAHITAVLADGPNLYAAGRHVAENGVPSHFVAKWDGDDWTVIPLQTYSSHFGIPLAVFNGQIHTAGQFLTADGQLDSKVVRWDGTVWQPVGPPLPDPVYALAEFDGALYAGGGLDDWESDAGSSTRGMLARWNGASWTQVGAALDGPVESLLGKGDSLYVGGCFSTVGSNGSRKAAHIARWDGSEWFALGAGVGSDRPCSNRGAGGASYDTVRSMAFYKGDLVVGGTFDHTGGVETRNIARWDGQSWLRYGDGYDRRVDSLAVDDGDLFATGAYGGVVDGAAIPGVARWNGTSWRPVTEPDAGVELIYTLESHGEELYAGGEFHTAGGTEIRTVARWNGIRWLPLGDGLDGYVYDIAVDGGVVFVMGTFRMSPLEPYRNHMAKWDGVSWKPLAEFSQDFYEIEIYDGELYAAGSLGWYGSRLARWNGQKWKTIAEVEKGTIHGLEAGDKLYVHGNLGPIGDVDYADVASWDGSEWTALPPVNGWIDSLAWSGSELFATGDFRLSDSYEWDSVARWNDAEWIPLGGSNEFTPMYISAASGSDLFVDGNGLLIDGVPHDGLAHWDGTTWHAVGHMRPYVMSFVGDKLYVGGVLLDSGGNARETVGLYALGPCGNGVVDAGEECDHGIEGTGWCCNANTCRLADSGSVCRASRGPCDRIETCSGASADCPADEIQPAGFVCRQPVYGCSSVGLCDGVGLTCSADVIPPCGDGDFCNGQETCGFDGACQSGIDVDCDDGDACTVEYCSEGNEFCRRRLVPGPGCSLCGDVDYDGVVTTIDALLALRGAVGIEACPAFPCDFDGSGLVTAADAFRILKAAVGTPVTPACPGDTAA